MKYIGALILSMCVLTACKDLTPEEIAARNEAAERQRIENSRLRRIVCYDANGVMYATKFTDNAEVGILRGEPYGTAYSRDGKYTETYKNLACKVDKLEFSTEEK